MTRLFDQIEVLGRIALDDAPATPGSEEALKAAATAIRFIETSGQTYDFEDYVQSLEAYAPPLAIGRFATREEAEAGMRAWRRPPAVAFVLIADTYHSAMYVPSTGKTHLVSLPIILEHYLADMANDGPKPSGLSFDSRAEAEAWLHQQPTPPQQVVILIAGAPYLAAYHHRIDYRVLYPLPPPTPPASEA
ncbi:head protein [Corallococcus praedator]|uniref:Head protein n=1 Tax=Corallococcus praedator TaxID=2316724 RepID=A0ABX9Q6E2_9BACT|nr:MULTISPECIES: head protein [Corallococcus]RKG99231.1 head protein [Corallococcus sp. CA047B]RKH18543.1 head protein [Corallococcus sp. CA031C]RKH91786.1 head protein [Corallococcus praedator]